MKNIFLWYISNPFQLILRIETLKNGTHCCYFYVHFTLLFSNTLKSLPHMLSASTSYPRLFELRPGLCVLSSTAGTPVAWHHPGNLCAPMTSVCPQRLGLLEFVHRVPLPGVGPPCRDGRERRGRL